MTPRKKVVAKRKGVRKSEGEAAVVTLSPVPRIRMTKIKTTAGWQPRKIVAPPKPPDLRTAARRIIALMEEMITTGALRLPYPGVIESLADLKRAVDKL